MIPKRVILISVSILFALTSFAETDQARKIVHLLDYLSQDYGGAVSSGQVISRSEYQEQLEFSESAEQLAHQVGTLADKPQILSNLGKIRQLIQEKAPEGQVSTLAQLTKKQIIEITHMKVAPDHWPSLSHGKILFSQTCVTCHGAAGDGKGPAAESLNPRPANFLDEEKMKNLSPFKAFNAVKVGVPGTSMAPQPQLGDRDVWDLAFYVISLRHQKKAMHVAPEAFKALAMTLTDVATLSDEELEKKLSSRNLAVLRLHSGDDENGNSLEFSKSKLEEAVADYREGRPESAQSKALMAYLEGVEPVEPRLKASDPTLTVTLEARMADVRSAIAGKQPIVTVQTAVKAAEDQLNLASLLLSKGSPSPWLTFLIAAAILLREGFEAILIIIALLGVIRASGSKAAQTWVHGGWIVAIFMGGVAWLLSGWLMAISGAQREMMEGVTSLLAVVVLLYMGFWLHRTTEIGRWTKFINSKVKKALDGEKLFGLGVISFMAVFREAFETVLFLRALWVEGGVSTKWAMAAGTGFSFGLVIFLAWLFLRFTTKVPIRTLFSFSASLMALLSVILVGKGIHSLQETGALGITASPLNLRVDLLGVFPTLETMITQLIILGAVTSFWFWGRASHPKHKPIRIN